MTDQSGMSGVTSDDKLWSALGYPIPLISIIVLLMEKRSRVLSSSSMPCSL